MKKENEQRALSVFNTLCEYLEENGLKYEKHEENLTIRSIIVLEDLPIPFRVCIRSDLELIALYSNMPFEIPDDRVVPMAIAVCKANNGLIDGNFDYSLGKKDIVFRINSIYLESVIGKELFDYLIKISLATIDSYNDKFLTVAKTQMSVKEIIDFIK